MNVCLILFMNIIHYFIHKKKTHTHIIYKCFACFICIRLHDISLFINLNIVNVSQKICWSEILSILSGGRVPVVKRTIMQSPYDMGLQLSIVNLL